MKTIHIRKADGSPAVFNFEHVISIELGKIHPTEMCVITFITGQTWAVEEGFHRLMGRILGHSDMQVQKLIDEDEKRFEK